MSVEMRNKIRYSLCSWVSTRFKISIESLNTKSTLSELGLSSIDAVEMLRDFSTEYEYDVSPIIFWKYPSIDALAEFLSKKESGSETIHSNKKNESAREFSDEPIAVVGMSCRFPGAENIDEFWQILLNGIDATGDVPSDRWESAHHYNADFSVEGKTHVKRGGFLDRCDSFDPAFFSISPKEAIEMDPQQRLLLELSWEALENAKVIPSDLQGSRTGVYVGAMWHDYEHVKNPDLRSINSRRATGQSHNMMANRVSYCFGLEGPSMVVDTACSSSLVALHIACQNLRTGEVDLALGAGVSLLISVESMIAMSKFGGLAADGRCKTFSDNADGYARGEGGGVLVLKRLRDARADGDIIYGLIHGSAVNNDGGSNGLTAPNPMAQENVLRDAWQRANLDPAHAHYIEAHGTGTKLGDPIEAAALSEIFGQGRHSEQPLIVGSVKTNIGHLEPAAGMAGMIKTLLAIQHKRLPPSLHFDTPNRYIDFDQLKLKVPTSVQSWPTQTTNDTLVAGVSSFGWGGTNSHIVLTSAPEAQAVTWVGMSADSPSELTHQLDSAQSDPVSHFSVNCSARYRCAFSYRSESQKQAAIHALARDITVDSTEIKDTEIKDAEKNDMYYGCVDETPRKVAFVFGPHGAQWPGMARNLLRELPIFRQAFKSFNRTWKEYSDLCLLSELCRDQSESFLNKIDVVQPLLFAFNYALMEQWRHWGIVPDLVIGHSVGEINALHCAGVLSLKESARVVYHSTQLLASIEGEGGMILASCEAKSVQDMLDKYGDALSIAAYNSQESIGLATDEAIIDEVLQELKSRNIRCARIAISAAEHSPHVDRLQASLLESLDSLDAKNPEIPMISTVNGEFLTGPIDANYIFQYIRQPVRFSDALQTALHNGVDTFIEVGPHPVLGDIISDAISLSRQEVSPGAQGVKQNIKYVSSLSRGEEDLASLFDARSQLFVLGLPKPIDQNLQAGAAPLLFPISATSDEALKAQARELLTYVNDFPDIELTDIAYALATTRTHFNQRSAILANNREVLKQQLSALSQGSPDSPISPVLKPMIRSAVFTGQGSQYPGMGRDLYANFPVFRRVLDEVCAVFDMWLETPLLDVMFDQGGSLVNQTEYTQPALFAYQVGLYRQFQDWGFSTDYFIGHSIGELTAAYLAGLWSLPDACKLIAARGRIMQSMPTHGAMVSVQASEQEVLALLRDTEGRVNIAGLNGPQSVVISGDETAVLAIAQKLKECKPPRRTKRLSVSHAFHSSHMDGALEEFKSIAATVEYRLIAPAFTLVSNLTGKVADHETISSADYWVAQLRNAVRFYDGVEFLESQGVNCFLEIGPQTSLSSLLAVQDQQDNTVVIPAGRTKDLASVNMVKSLASLFEAGQSVSWHHVFTPDLLPASGFTTGSKEVINLPTYQFQRERYWVEHVLNKDIDAGIKQSESDRSFWQAVEQANPTELATLLGAQDHETQKALQQVIPTLAAWHSRREQLDKLEQFSYRIDWQPLQPETATTESSLAGSHWYIVNSESGEDGQDDENENSCLHQLCEYFEGVGATVTRITLNASDINEEHIANCLREHIKNTPEPRGILSLLGLSDDMDVSVEQDLPLGFSGNVSLAQGVILSSINAPIWFLTKGAITLSAGHTVTRPLQSATWGFGRVFALEHPELWGGLIDLPHDGILTTGKHDLAAALECKEGEDHFACSDKGMMVRRLVQLKDWIKPNSERFDDDVILITGGTGALGRQLVPWFVGRGAKRLVLLSRRGEAANGIADLRSELGSACELIVLACDVSDRESLSNGLQQLAADGIDITVCIHAAGAFPQASSEDNSSLDVFVEAFSGKVNGAIHLHNLLDNNSLRAFVSFSSVVGIWGTIGGGERGAYAAANAYLDGLSEYRRSLGLPSTSIAWGPWDLESMADESTRANLARLGIDSLDPTVALDVLGHAINSPHAGWVVSGANWQKLSEVFNHRHPVHLFDDLWSLPKVPAVEPGGEKTSLEKELMSLDRDAKHRYLINLVVTTTANVLGHSDTKKVDPESGFFDLGLDSIGSIELNAKLKRATGLTLEATSTFDYPSPESLGLYIAQTLFPEQRLPEQPILEQPLSEQPLPKQQASSATMAEATSDTSEPLAIVGLGLQLPGGVVDLESFWTLLENGDDTLGLVPQERWDMEALFDGDPDARGKAYTRHGTFLNQIDQFDADFFGISPREAKEMDPQHRLLMETTWHALEDAGILPSSLKGSDTGIFVGIGPSDYEKIQGQRLKAEAHTIIGTHASFASGRLAFTLGTNGPAISVDTACSSSLVALHQASQSLRKGECNLALAAGVQIMASPEIFMLMSRTRALSKDGRCKTFSANADGYGRGEGSIVLVLERLSSAQKNQRNILALLKGTAVNHDGASSGITAPNGPAQQKVVRAALADAQLQPSDVSVVECHGTGTALGDPIEVQALAAAYGPGRNEDEPLQLSAVKPTIGHLESAAGLAGIAKLIASLQYQKLPATLHCEPLNPHINWSNLPVDVVSKQRDWPSRDDSTRRAGVSAFGFSGTNAHAIIEESPTHTDALAESSLASSREALLKEGESAAMLFPLSGKTPQALQAQGQALLHWLERNPQAPIEDVSATLAFRRMSFKHRAVVQASSRKQLLERLRIQAQGLADVQRVNGEAKRSRRVVFVFPGQGAQWAAMAQSLLQTSPVFRHAIEACEEALSPVVDWSLLSVLREEKDAPSLKRVDVVQPVLFAMMVALTRLWQAHGVQPDAVIGHSQGEIAAAYIAGVLTLEDAAKIVAVRSKLALSVVGKGAMASVEEPADALRLRLKKWGNLLSVAAINGLSSSVVSGDVNAIDELVEELQSEQIFARKVRVDIASHSSQMDALKDDLLANLADIQHSSSHVPFYSTVDAMRCDGAGLTPNYWFRNLRQSVLMSDTVDLLLDDGHSLFLEISAHPLLLVPLNEQLAARESDAVALGSLRRDEGSIDHFRLAVASVYTVGYPLDWHILVGDRKHLSLPGYAFQHQAYWLDDEKLASSESQSSGVLPVPVDSTFWSAVQEQDIEALGTMFHLDQTQQMSLSAVLPAMGQWWQTQKSDNSANDCRYQLRWEPLSRGVKSTLSGSWVIFCDSTATDAMQQTKQLLQTCFEEAGLHVQCVSVDLHSMGLQKVDEPVLSDYFEAQLSAISDASPRAISGVLSLLDLSGSTHTAESSGSIVSNGVCANLLLIQACQTVAQMPLYLCTQQAVSIGNSDPLVNVHQAMNWGLGTVASLEHRESWGGLIDFPAHLERAHCQRLIEAMASAPEEDALVLRENSIYVRRMVRFKTTEMASNYNSWTTKHSALVTGDSDGITPHIAKWLVQRGCEHVLVLSRQGARAENVSELTQEIESLGAKISFIECDIAVAHSLTDAVNDLRKQGHNIHTVIHAAGINQRGTLLETSTDDLERLAAAKVGGALELDQLFQDKALDGFILFSSGAGVWGSSGQSAYAAANACLDALALKRQAKGLSATSVAWGAYAKSDILDNDDTAQLERTGVLPMAPALILHGLQQALEQRDNNLVFSAMNWEAFAADYRFGRSRPLLNRIAEAKEQVTSDESQTERSDSDSLADTLSPLGAKERITYVTKLVTKVVADILGRSDLDNISPTSVFSSLGLDSLMSVQMRNQLASATGLSLPSTLAFDHPSAQLAAQYLLDTLDLNLTESVAAATPPEEALVHSKKVNNIEDITGMDLRLPSDVELIED